MVRIKRRLKNRRLERSIEKLRKRMMEYDTFAINYPERVKNAPLKDLVGLVRSEMYIRHKAYAQGPTDKDFLDRYFKIRGVHGLAISLAFDAGLIDNTHKRYTFDLHNFAAWGSEKEEGPTIGP